MKISLKSTVIKGGNSRFSSYEGWKQGNEKYHKKYMNKFGLEFEIIDPAFLSCITYSDIRFDSKIK